jgi:hypothetical protein
MTIVNQPVEFPGAGGIEANFGGSAAQGSEDGSLEIALEIENDIKRPFPQL